MTDYSKGVIYKIECNLTNDVYYGSTTLSLSQRIGMHKSKGNCRAINIIDRGNYTCKIIEEYPCNNSKELEARESYYIRNNECINKQIPGRTHQEWCEDNKVHIAQQNKERYQANKVHIVQKVKEYQEANKAYLKEYCSTKIQCECGCVLRRGSLARHSRTKKHLDYISTLN